MYVCAFVTYNKDYLFTYLLYSLSLHFNGHFPTGPGLASEWRKYHIPHTCFFQAYLGSYNELSIANGRITSLEEDVASQVDIIGSTFAVINCKQHFWTYQSSIYEI